MRKLWSMNKTRILITKKCKRNCSYCANNFYNTLDTIDFEGLKKYDEIILTGGEPMDFPIQTYYLIKSIRERYLNKKIYLYISRYDVMLEDILNFIDGITYTIHKDVSCEDIHQYIDFTYLLNDYKKHNPTLYKNKSFKLVWISSLDFGDYPIVTLNDVWIWNKVTYIQHIGEDTCKNPKDLGEDLFLWFRHFTLEDDIWFTENLIK